MAKAKRVAVFGVFDLLHPGHLYLLYHARRAAGPRGELLAVVARDAAVRRLKGRAPAWNERRRIKAVLASGLAAKATLGDAREGEYRVLKRLRPDLICLGYDQLRLRNDLRRRMKAGALPRTPLKTLRAHQEGRLHSSFIRNGHAV